MSWKKYSTALFGAGLGCLTYASARALEWPPAPTDLGSPSVTVSGASRGICNYDAVPPLSPVVPNETTFTARARPTLYAYVPPMTAKAQIVIYDVWAKDIVGDPEDIDVPTSPGILPVSLPEGVFLEPGRLYVWSFSIYCHPNDTEPQAYVGSMLQRVEKSVADENLPDAPLERARWYLQHHLWHETVAELASVRSRYPNEWQELLKSVGLTGIHAKPLLGSQPAVSERNAWWLPSTRRSGSVAAPDKTDAGESDDR